ncbi:hypothetical protein EZS27_000948 [termite gut metagenome]|jgi:quercetin dioxygenase-like cupin family protein|uniref:Cupin type-2 domain-containing protein n=1 Tax=termite gut metagenome TaxID=433724 RepID=A0A5J4T087_9ZZZZ
MKTRSKNYVLANETEWEVAGKGVRRQILGYDGQLMLVKVEFQQGAVGSGHAHYHSQSTYVASGVFEFHIDGENRIVKTGDGIYIAPDIYHGCTCVEAGILIDSFSPVREDFLKK